MRGRQLGANRDCGHPDGYVVRAACWLRFPRREAARRQMPVPPVGSLPKEGPRRAARCQMGGAPRPGEAGAGARRSLLRRVVPVGVWWQVCELVQYVIALRGVVESVGVRVADE